MEFLPKEIEDYCRLHSQDEPEIYRQLTADTYESCQIPQMLSGPIVGTILQFFCKTYTGSSSSGGGNVYRLQRPEDGGSA